MRETFVMGTLALMIAGCDAKPTRPSTSVRAGMAPADASCDAACSQDANCCTEVFVHGTGAPIGWLRRGAGAPIPVPSADPDAIVLEFKRWLLTHGTVAGLAPMADAAPLDGLSPWSTSPQRYETLSTHRLHQKYRGVEVFGAGETVTLTVAQQHGIIAVHGAIADARETYAGWDAPLELDAALAAGKDLLAVLHVDDEELDPVVYDVTDPKFVAVVEIEAMAYTMRLLKNGEEVGIVVVRADNGAMLNMSFHAAASLPDPAPVEVRGRTFQSDAYALDDAAKQFVADFAQLQGEPLFGSVYMPLACQQDPQASPKCGETRLGNLEVAVSDALGQSITNKNLIPFVPTHPEGKFLAQPPASKDDPVTAETRAAALQDAFYRLLATVRLFAPFKAGRWDSLWLDKSGFGTEFVPRLAFFFDAPGCPAGAPGCAHHYFPHPVIDGMHISEYDEHPWTDLPAHRPPEGLDEAMGFITIYTEGFRSIDMLQHEYGHVVDIFTSAFMIGDGVIGSGCEGIPPGETCKPACKPDSTDESPALRETFADWMGIFAIGRQYTNVTYDSNCSAVSSIANAGVPTPVHAPTCVDSPDDIRSFLDERPTAPGHIPTDDGPIPTGKCSTSAGYHQGALVTAWWEWTHARQCAIEVPFACASFGEDGFGASTGVEAMLYAASLTNKTYYKQFITDAETYMQCVHGDALGARWREVWCHHGALECAQLPPPCPPICGDGVVQGDEECDLQDMFGKTCDNLGLGGGALSCKPDCTLDTSMCLSAPTTGDEPTTGGAPPPSESSDSSGAPDSATATAGGVGYDDGCGCAAPSSGGFWLLGLVPLLRRRRSRLDVPAHEQ